MSDIAAEDAARPLYDRVRSELLDSLDEELELELDDERLAAQLGEVVPHHPSMIGRKAYFAELLRLQRELVKLQDWVVHEKLKVVVVFEGRDSAGKGGVI